jgi:hypothetical protein
LQGCNPAKGWTCRQPHEIVPLVEVADRPSGTLYCFSVYTKETGSTKKTHELELLQEQYKRKVSIFSCNYYDVFSDVLAQVGDGYPTIQVHDVENNFHSVKRKKVGTWVNTGIFKQVWKSIKGRSALQEVNWVVKVDADAVFVPQRLRNVLANQPVSWQGVYVENCEGVEYGFFGNLEVFSKKAFNLLLDNIDSCSEKIDWVKGTKWGPIGEDLFAQMCMDYQGVTKVQNFGITTDGTCPGTRKKYGSKDNKKWKPPCNEQTSPALHPFKKPQDYFACLDATVTLDAGRR